MCQCIRFLILSIIVQSCHGCRSVFNRLYDRIQSWQMLYASVEVNLFNAARLQNPNLTSCPDPPSYSRGGMGVYLRTKTKTTSSLEKWRRERANDTASESCKHILPRRVEALAGSNQKANSRKLCVNGTCSMASLFTQRGYKGINQDALIVWEDFGGIEDAIFCGVFDGHGPDGHLVAWNVRDYLPLKLVSNCQAQRHATKDSIEALHDRDAESSREAISRMNGEQKKAKEEVCSVKESRVFAFWKESILSAYKMMDKELGVKPNIDSFRSGTTALTLIKQGQEVILGNVGDSRAVLGTKSDDNSLVAIPLTIDLKPNLPQEEERIRKCRGRVFALDDEPEVYRVWLPYDDSPGLAMSRAFGDFCLKKFGVIAVPEVTHRHLNERDQFIILATDGIWDVLSNEEVVEIVSSVSARPYAAKAVVDAAVQAWKCKYPTSKVDDCAVVCLYVDKFPTVPDIPEQKHKRFAIERQTYQGGPENLCRFKTDSAGKGKIEGSSLQQIPTIAVVEQNSDLAIAEPPLVSCPEIDENDWEDLEGIFRVNSLVNLPRFTPGDKRSGV